MDFLDQIQTLTTKVQRQREHIQTEEATKNAFVMPFISALGYDVFDPTEVVPEFTADVGIKKGEKVDYAIMQDGKPILLFECKQCSVDLDETHASQLYRYFSATEARIAVLTNGIVYRFYTDLENPNQMDTKPFLEVDILDLHESLVNELKKLTKSAFNLDDLLTTASELKYTREIRILLEEQLTSPSEEFVRFFTGHVYTGLKTQAVLEQFAGIVKRAMYQFINDQINRRLKSVLGEEQLAESERSGIDEEDTKDLGQNSRIVTTEGELEGFYIVKSILRETVDLKRIAPRDAINYFGISLDDSNRLIEHRSISDCLMPRKTRHGCLSMTSMNFISVRGNSKRRLDIMISRRERLGRRGRLSDKSGVRGGKTKKASSSPPTWHWLAPNQAGR